MPTILITGASRGLGLEFTRQYAEDGATVIAACRAPEKAEALRALAARHASLRIEPLDVADTSSIAALSARLHATPVDLLINNAGIYSGTDGTLGNDTSQSFGTIDAAAWEKVLRVNTIAPILLLQALIPNLKRGEGRKIVNITSRMGSLAEMGPDSIAYRSSKAALNAAMRVVMHAMNDEKLSIYNFHPGWVQTDMGGKNARLTPPESVTAMRRTIASLTARQSGSYLNYDGAVIPW